MNKLSTYIPSLIVSVLLVLMILCSTATLVFNASVSSEKAYALVNDKNLGDVVQTELNKYYYKRYNSTGIPADTYAVSTDYILQCEKECIDQAFYALEYGENPDIHIPESSRLEDNIDEFFNDYASKAGYKKDSNFDKKIDDTIDDAYATIKDHCDVYKVSALAEHKVLLRISSLYKYRSFAAIAACTACAFFILLFVIINRKKKINVLYWLGISALIAGLAGVVPSAVLISNKYFDSFSIKQDAVFIAYTSAMYGMTGAFMKILALIALIGVVMIVLYASFRRKNVKNENKK